MNKLFVGDETELRVLAASQASAVDAHTATAAEMFKVPVAEVTPEQRAAAKSRNWYELYQGDNKLYGGRP